MSFKVLLVCLLGFGAGSAFAGEKICVSPDSGPAPALEVVIKTTGFGLGGKTSAIEVYKQGVLVASDHGSLSTSYCHVFGAIVRGSHLSMDNCGSFNDHPDSVFDAKTGELLADLNTFSCSVTP